MSSTSGRIAWALAPLGVGLGTLAVGAAVLIPFRSLSSDEAVAFARADQPLGDLLHLVARHQPAQAGYLLILKGATLAGTDERSLRVASVLALALAAALMVVLGTLLLGHVEGLIAGILLGTGAGALEVARTAGPYTIGLLGVVLCTLLLVLALERRHPWWWALYAVSCVLLPLTHPLAASVLAAHAAALALHREGRSSRGGVAVAAAATVLAALLVGWLAAVRHDASDGTTGLDLGEVARGVGRAAGWSPVLAIAAVGGLAALLLGMPVAVPRWKPVLVTGLVAAPLAVILLASLVLPVFPDPALVSCAPGLALAAGAAYRLFPARRSAAVGLTVLVATSFVATAATIGTPPAEDWKALAASARRHRSMRETIVVVPERSRAAFAYYAPHTRTSLYARGEGAWVAVVAKDPLTAIAVSREVVPTPRYALQRQSRYGKGLRLQHWVRP